MTNANQDSWKILAAPPSKEPLNFKALFSSRQVQRILRGFIPDSMDDKWFIYFANGWLNFHRSWTGAHIYAIQLEISPQGAQVLDSWVNRDAQQYNASDTAYDRALLKYLIDAFLLDKNTTFPPRPHD